MNPNKEEDIEISEATKTTYVQRDPPGKRLRIAIEALEVGSEFTFRSVMERQHIYNVIAKVKHKTGRSFTTRRLQKPDAEGKSITRIVRLPDSQ